MIAAFNAWKVRGVVTGAKRQRIGCSASGRPPARMSANSNQWASDSREAGAASMGFVVLTANASRVRI
jgi:hypothetical protein